MVDKNCEVVTIPADEYELAVSKKTQQKAALHAIAIGLLYLGNTPHKKRVKRVAKKLRREVLSEIAGEGALDILEGNISAVKGTVDGLRKSISKQDGAVRRKFLNTITKEWYVTFEKGVKNLYG